MFTVNMDMHPGFFAGEEKEAKSAFVEYSRTHLSILILARLQIAVVLKDEYRLGYLIKFQ